MKKIKTNSFLEKTTTSVFDLTLVRFDYGEHVLYFLSYDGFYFCPTNLLVTGFSSQEIINDFIDDVDDDVDMENSTLEDLLKAISNSSYTIKDHIGITAEDLSYLKLYKALEIIKEEL